MKRIRLLLLCVVASFAVACSGKENETEKNTPADKLGYAEGEPTVTIDGKSQSKISDNNKIDPVEEKNSEVVVYEQGKHPLSTLESYRDDMWKKLEENGIQPYSGYVDQFTRTIKLGVAEENVESATAFLEGLIAGGEYGDLSTEEVEVSKGGMASPDTSNIYS